MENRKVEVFKCGICGNIYNISIYPNLDKQYTKNKIAALALGDNIDVLPWDRDKIELEFCKCRETKLNKVYKVGYRVRDVENNREGYIYYVTKKTMKVKYEFSKVTYGDVTFLPDFMNYIVIVNTHEN